MSGESRPDRPPPSVLVVDDEEMVLTSIRTFLELETDHRVATHTSPAEALDALAEAPADVVVADFMMPRMDGVTFLARARALRPHAARILLTGYADVENAIRGINEAGLYYYLEKPWDNARLKLIIQNGVERAALARELDARLDALGRANRELEEIRQRLLRAFL